MKDFIPSTKEDRYVSRALNLLTFLRNVAASSMFLPRAICSSISMFDLPVVKPCALIHLALGAENLSPANSFVGLNIYPTPSQAEHFDGRAKGAPFFLVLRNLPTP